LAIDLTHFIGLSKSTPNSAKSSQARTNPGKANQRKKAWISLDSLGGIEPFQWVIVTPEGKKSFLAPFPRNRPSYSRAFVPEHAPKVTRASNFHKRIAAPNLAGNGGGIGVS
jgi:hypothetical protein